MENLPSDYSGYSVSLSADGSVVAIGAYLNDGNGGNSGHVRIYENDNGTWTQIGSDIDGEGSSSDYSGNSVSLHQMVLLWLLVLMERRWW